MGNLADTFFVRLKPEIRDASIEILMPHIPSQYQRMFSILWGQFASLEHILDSGNMARIEPMDIEEAPPGVVFTHRYRGECLQQILRHKFFDTLLIVQNVYSPDKRNVIHVLREGEAVDIRAYPKWYSDRTESGKPKWRLAFPVEDMISEREWENAKPADETFRNIAKIDLEAKGFRVHIEDHI